MIRRRSLLAVTPDLSVCDSNRRLVSLLDELGRVGAIDGARTRVVAGAGGPLASEIARTADLSAVRVVGDAPGLAGEVAARVHPSVRSVGERIGLAWGLARRPVRTDPGRPDLVWAQGVEALHLAAALPRGVRRAPVVAHLPEGPEGLRRGTAGADPARLLGLASVIVTTSDEQREHLAAAHGVDPGRVLVHPDWRPGPLHADARRRRRPGGVPEDALVVGAAGPVGWRSGTDLLLDLAARLPTAVDGHPVHVVAIGGPDRPGDRRRARADVALRGLGGRVHLVDDSDGAAALAAGFDVVVVPSREPPVPLAVLDAGAAGVPAVGLTGSGLEGLLPPGDLDAAVVERFDLATLAERVEGLLRDPRARQLFGSSLRVHVDRHHRAADHVGAVWADVAGRLART